MATDERLDVGLVIVTFNSGAVIPRLLDSLEDGLKGLQWRAVVVDNASTDDSVMVVDAAGFEVLSLESNKGYAAAINRGIRLFPTARSVLVLNPDVELTPGAVGAMMEVLTDERVGIVAPKTFVPGTPPHIDLTQRRDPSLLNAWATAILSARVVQLLPALSESVSQLSCYDVTRDVDWAVGAVLLVSRRCVDAVGDWDESYFLYSEETDYCQRARRAGFTVRYTPDAVVLHRGGGGVDNPRLRSMMSINRVRQYRRRHGAVVSWCFFAAVVVHELTRGLAGRAEARQAAMSLLVPRRRPLEINVSSSLMPR
jgi:N-acetylglucosaminyl-diphospho-decaprenol L-rhamnosyltransferase